MFKVREAKMDDYDQILPIYQELHNLHVKERPDYYIPTAVPIEKKDLEQILGNEQKKMFVVEKSGQVIAFSVIRKVYYQQTKTEKDYPFVFIEDFCVRDEDRGKGIGGNLFEKVKRFGKQVGAKGVEIKVLEFNQRALRFSEKMGMRGNSRNIGFKL